MRQKDGPPRGLGGLLRRLEWALNDASIRWRFRHAMRRSHPAPMPRPHELVVVCDGLYPRHNIGRILRSAEVFGAREVHVIGTPVFDPAPATTALHAIPLRLFADREASFADLRARGYTLIVLETGPDAASQDQLPHAELPRKAALVVGNETTGVGFSRDEYPDARWVTIPQYGETECLDVASAAAIAMYEYARRWGERRG
jgi:tRNA G18 (ribose-2'-O)-methylase SpoU